MHQGNGQTDGGVLLTGKAPTSSTPTDRAPTRGAPTDLFSSSLEEQDPVSESRTRAAPALSSLAGKPAAREASGRGLNPPHEEPLAETAARFREALEAFVEKVKQDRTILAAILFGSLSHDTVWRKSDIDLVLIGREEKPVSDFCLLENGVNIHASLYPRSQFKKALEGSLQGAFWHSSFALSTLLFTTDDTIRAYYEDVRRIGSHDRQMRLMGAGSAALYTLAKAEKWLLTRSDVSYSFLWIMYTLENLATIEVLLHGELTSREVIPHALKLNPVFFHPVYEALIQQPKDEATIREALALINEYIETKLHVLFGPILEYLAQEGGIRTTSELNGYFKNQVRGQGMLSMAYEWLADKGILQKVPSPRRLTPKSQVTVDEAAYYYDGEPLP